MAAQFPRSDRHAQLVWFDPGSTTGLVALCVRPAWLEGAGEPSWAGLNKAVRTRWFGQVGREARIVDDGRARRPLGKVVVVERRGDRTGRVDAETEMIRQCEELLDIWLDAAWGYEDFQLRVLGADPSPIRVFSALRYVEAVHGERRRQPFVQSASMAKSTATDERLRMAGLYVPGMPHATDAARHAATFLRKARADALLRHMAWPRLFRQPAEAAAG